MGVGFLLLIGLPSSGKTTLAKHLLQSSEQTSEKTHHFIHICYDDLINFSNEIQEFKWKLARNSVSVKVEKIVVAIKNKNVDICPLEFKNQLTPIKNWQCNFIIILDDNMYFKSMRYSLFQIAKKHGIGFCQVFLNCSLDSAFIRNDLREPNSRVPPHVIRNIHSKIEPPNCKNNWEKYSVEIKSICNLNEIHIKILPILNESLDNVFHENYDSEIKKLSKIQCQKNIMHQSDLALRKIVGCKVKKYLQENSEINSKAFIESLNLRKSEILSDIKMENICLPEEILEEINSDAVEKINLINFLDHYLY